MHSRLPVIDFSRTIIVGTSCSGKSTLAVSLSQHFGVPHVELDALYWMSDWTPRPSNEFRQLITEKTSHESWIIDGNYGAARDLFWPRATCVIWLNYNLVTLLYRGLRRAIINGVSRKKLFGTNYESLQRTFCSKNSILLWILSTNKRRRLEISDIRESKPYGDIPTIELKTPRQTKEFFRTFLTSRLVDSQALSR